VTLRLRYSLVHDAEINCESRSGRGQYQTPVQRADHERHDFWREPNRPLEVSFRTCSLEDGIERIAPYRRIGGGVRVCLVYDYRFDRKLRCSRTHVISIAQPNLLM
jgi:hypothetical protein